MAQRPVSLRTRAETQGIRNQTMFPTGAGSDCLAIAEAAKSATGPLPDNQRAAPPTAQRHQRWGAPLRQEHRRRPTTRAGRRLPRRWFWRWLGSSDLVPEPAVQSGHVAPDSAVAPETSARRRVLFLCTSTDWGGQHDCVTVDHRFDIKTQSSTFEFERSHRVEHRYTVVSLIVDRSVELGEDFAQRSFRESATARRAAIRAAGPDCGNRSA